MKKKTAIILSILVVLITILILVLSSMINNEAREKAYDVSATIYSIVKVSDSYFEEQKKNEYKDYDLVFVSFSLKNNTGKNLENINYKLKTSNQNTYSNTSGGYITKDNPYLVENFLKVIGHSYNKEEKILGKEEKRVIIGFMLPKNELKNGNDFKVEITEQANIQALSFKNEDIKNSQTLKELFLDNEIEEIEQKISLYYLAENVINLQKLQADSWNARHVEGVKLYLTLSTQCFETKFSRTWDGQFVEEGIKGYKINFERAKELLPEIKNNIMELENSEISQKNVANVLKQYNDLEKVNYSEYTSGSYKMANSATKIINFLKQ